MNFFLFESCIPLPPSLFKQSALLHTICHWSPLNLPVVYLRRPPHILSSIADLRSQFFPFSFYLSFIQHLFFTSSTLFVVDQFIIVKPRNCLGITYLSYSWSLKFEKWKPWLLNPKLNLLSIQSFLIFLFFSEGR